MNVVNPRNQLNTTWMPANTIIIEPEEKKQFLVPEPLPPQYVWLDSDTATHTDYGTSSLNTTVVDSSAGIPMPYLERNSIHYYGPLRQALDFDFKHRCPYPGLNTPQKCQLISAIAYYYDSPHYPKQFIICQWNQLNRLEMIVFDGDFLYVKLLFSFVLFF